MNLLGRAVNIFPSSFRKLLKIEQSHCELFENKIASSDILNLSFAPTRYPPNGTLAKGLALPQAAWHEAMVLDVRDLAGGLRCWLRA
jgi:hypothetical protein